MPRMRQPRLETTIVAGIRRLACDDMDWSPAILIFTAPDPSANLTTTLIARTRVVTFLSNQLVRQHNGWLLDSVISLMFE